MTFDDISKRQREYEVRSETIIALIRRLAAQAHAPEVIYARVKVLEFMLGDDEDKNQRALASELGVSEARVSAAIKYWTDIITDIKGQKQ